MDQEKIWSKVFLGKCATAGQPPSKTFRKRPPKGIVCTVHCCGQCQAYGTCRSSCIVPRQMDYRECNLFKSS